MPEYKKQHYIPQHYMRQFGLTNIEKISLARIEPYRFVQCTGIRDQCQEDYFYGDDGELETLLGLAESDIAPVIVSVCRKKSFTDGELGALRMLAVLLYARTKKAFESAKLFPKEVFSTFVEHGIATGQFPEPTGGWTRDMVDVSGVAKTMIAEAIPCWLETLTLKCKLLEAPADAAFITSDHPALTLNQFAVDAHPLRKYVGFAQAGFQLLLPLAPQLCLYFYDERVYKVGSRAGHLVKVSNQDVETINSLQIQSAYNCIYFNETIPENKARNLIEKYKGLRRPLGDALLTLPGRTPEEEFLYSQPPPLKVTRQWTFSRILNIGRSRPGTRRDQVWTTAISKMIADIEAGNHRGPLPEHMEQVLLEMHGLTE